MNEKNKKVLLLGGTGAMGFHLAQILRTLHFQVFVTSRNKYLNNDGITYIQGNAHEDMFLKEQVAKTHYDTIVDFMFYNTNEFKSRISWLLDTTDQYVFLSSSRVYANSESPITEESQRLLDVCKDTNYLLTDEYALAKAREENLLKESGKQNYTIIRPYITYSEIRLQLGAQEKENWLMRALYGKKILFSEDIAEKYTTLTYGYDVAQGIASIIGKPNAYSETFHITCDTPIKWKDVLTIYLDTLESKLGKRPEVLWIPQHQSSNWKHPHYQVKYDRLYNRSFDNRKIQQFINTSQFIKPNEGLVKCMEMFLNNPKFRKRMGSSFADEDRITGDWSLPNNFNSINDYFRYILRRTILPRKH